MAADNNDAAEAAQQASVDTMTTLSLGDHPTQSDLETPLLLDTQPLPQNDSNHNETTTVTHSNNNTGGAPFLSSSSSLQPPSHSNTSLRDFPSSSSAMDQSQQQHLLLPQHPEPQAALPQSPDDGSIQQTTTDHNDSASSFSIPHNNDDEVGPRFCARLCLGILYIGVGLVMLLLLVIEKGWEHSRMPSNGGEAAMVCTRSVSLCTLVFSWVAMLVYMTVQGIRMMASLSLRRRRRRLCFGNHQQQQRQRSFSVALFPLAILILYLTLAYLYVDVRNRIVYGHHHFRHHHHHYSDGNFTGNDDDDAYSSDDAVPAPNDDDDYGWANLYQ